MREGSKKYNIHQLYFCEKQVYKVGDDLESSKLYHLPGRISVGASTPGKLYHLAGEMILATIPSAGRNTKRMAFAGLSIPFTG